MKLKRKPGRKTRFVELSKQNISDLRDALRMALAHARRLPERHEIIEPEDFAELCRQRAWVRMLSRLR